MRCSALRWRSYGVDSVGRPIFGGSSDVDRERVQEAVNGPLSLSPLTRGVRPTLRGHWRSIERFLRRASSVSTPSRRAAISAARAPFFALVLRARESMGRLKAIIDPDPAVPTLEPAI